MTQKVPARQEFEVKLRALLPEKIRIGDSLTEAKAGVAAVGFGGFLAGYFWGRIRGRRIRKGH